MEASFQVPCRGLVPAEIAERLLDSLDGASISCTASLSSRIVTIEGDLEQLESTSREVFQQLQEEGGGVLFVALVPVGSAGAVVGTRGQRVRELIERSGAAIDVKREVIASLRMQPVVVKGTLEQVLAGTMGINEVLQELVERGRLRPADFVLPGAVQGMAHEASAPYQPELVEEPLLGPSTGSTGLAPLPAVLVLDMTAMGYVIGKRGARVIELQRVSGAKISMANKGASLPGMRCGDRLLEISGDSSEQRDEGVRAVLAAVAEAPNGEATAVTVLVPVEAVGYVIGKNGQFLKELMSRLGAKVQIQQDGPPIAGARAAAISGPQQAEAALAVLGKVEELRVRLSGVAPQPEVLQQQPQPEVLQQQPHPRASPQPDADPIASWTARTPGEHAVLERIQASGVLSHKLRVRVPAGLLDDAALEELERKSGARLELEEVGAGPGHCFVTVVGQRLATALAALHLQEWLSQA